MLRLFSRPLISPRAGFRYSAIRLAQTKTPVFESKHFPPRVVEEETPKQNRPMTVNDELPDPFAAKRRNRRVFIGFWIVMGVSLFGIFNYEKVSSPVMSATMYFLRRSENARSKLGKSITFEGIFPWIRGELNTMKGNIDVQVRVAGDKAGALMKLRAARASRGDSFQIEEWRLIFDDGTTMDLLQDTSVNLEF